MENHNRRNTESQLDQIVQWESPRVGLHYLCNQLSREEVREIPSLVRENTIKSRHEEDDVRQNLIISSLLGTGGAAYEVASWFSQQNPDEMLTYGLAGVGTLMAARSLQRYLSVSKKREGYEALVGLSSLERQMMERAKRF